MIEDSTNVTMVKKDDDHKIDSIENGESKFFTKPKPTANKRITASRPNTKKTLLQTEDFTKDAKKQVIEKDNQKTRSSPAQDRRTTMQMMEQLNKPLTTAIEKLVETLNNKLDAAIETKNNHKEEDNQFNEIIEDKNTNETETKRIEKLREHQNTLCRMSQNLSEQLDNINPINTQRQQQDKDNTTNKENPTNLIRNLSITITSIEHKIKRLEDNHENKINSLKDEIEKLNINFNIHKNTCFPQRTIDTRENTNKEVKQNQNLNEDTNDKEKDDEFQLVKNKKRKKYQSKEFPPRTKTTYK